MMKRKDSVSFSIIIPVQNGEKTIERLLGSLIIQKQRILEVLICNDHSTDRTVEIVNQYKGVLPITVLNVPDELGNSPGNARQVGLDYASGEWIVFADSDDILTFNALGFYDSVIKTNPNSHLIVAAFDEVNFDPFYTIEHLYAPFAWVHAKAFNAAFIKKNNLRFHSTLFTHEDKYFTFLNVFSLKVLYDEEPLVFDTTTYYWCRSEGTIVSRDKGKYSLISMDESMDAMIESCEAVSIEHSLSTDAICKKFGTDLLSAIIDAYFKIQCSEFYWGKKELDERDTVKKVQKRIGKIKRLTGWNTDDIVRQCTEDPKMFECGKRDSIRTMGEFIPRQSFYEFLNEQEEAEIGKQS